ncbi:unnamed protein product [Nezara viridula]|uniref:Inosine/uridine-preferring nucleoside hydrolase domain-containing protein n=1 Tax=Nezara viridula TaxID=85310 RepID=A0A9P0E1C2_NEZVI|nr:unnamed protein product [Nezara viridula]
MYEAVYLVAAVAVLSLACGARELRYRDDLKVVIDTDVGADDAMAILMMLSKQSKAEVLAITTVKGNTGVENATRGALLISEVADRKEIPVYMGSPQGIIFEESSSNYFGYDGLGDIFDKPPLDLKKEGHAALALARLVKDNPGEISLLCIGPLTNLALAMHIYPRLQLDLKEIIILGGSYKGRGNVKPGVEFNIYMDPEAAALVFANVPQTKLITLLPLETIEENSYTKNWRLNDLGKIDSTFVNFLNKAEWLALANADETWLEFDPTAASFLLDPSIATSTKDAWVEVETSGTITRGAMILDQDNKKTNIRIVTGLDKVKLQSMLRTYLSD